MTKRCAMLWRRVSRLAAVLLSLGGAATAQAPFTSYRPELRAYEVFTPRGVYLLDDTRTVRFPPQGVLPESEGMWLRQGSLPKFFPGGGKYARLLHSPGENELRTFDARHRVLGQLPLNANVDKIFPTRSGVCVVLLVPHEKTFGTYHTRCYDDHLRRVWFSREERMTDVDADGQVGYFRPSLPPLPTYERFLPVVRVNLKTGVARTFQLDAHEGERDPAYREAIASTYDGQNDGEVRELPGSHLLAQVRLTSPPRGAGWQTSVLNRDFGVIATLRDKGGQAADLYWMLDFEASRSGRFLFGGQSAVRVWDRARGYALTWYFTDPAWPLGGKSVVAVRMSPDERQLLVLTEVWSGNRPAAKQYTAWIYELTTGRRLRTFAVRTP